MSLSNKKKIAKYKDTIEKQEKQIRDLKAMIDIINDTKEYYNDRVDCLTRIIYDNMSYTQIKKINEDQEYNEMTGYEFLVEQEINIDFDKDYEFVKAPSLD